jgi:hypothetical protein
MSSVVILPPTSGSALHERPLALRISRSVAFVCLLTVLAAAVRFAGIGHQGYWYDEADTVRLVHFSLVGMLSHVENTETSPPLYFLVSKHTFAAAGLRGVLLVGRPDGSFRRGSGHAAP